MNVPHQHHERVNEKQESFKENRNYNERRLGEFNTHLGTLKAREAEECNEILNKLKWDQVLQKQRGIIKDKKCLRVTVIEWTKSFFSFHTSTNPSLPKLL